MEHVAAPGAVGRPFRDYLVADGALHDLRLSYVVFIQPSMYVTRFFALGAHLRVSGPVDVAAGGVQGRSPACTGSINFKSKFLTSRKDIF